MGFVKILNKSTSHLDIMISMHDVASQYVKGQTNEQKRSEEKAGEQLPRLSDSHSCCPLLALPLCVQSKATLNVPTTRP